MKKSLVITGGVCLLGIIAVVGISLKSRLMKMVSWMPACVKLRLSICPLSDDFDEGEQLEFEVQQKVLNGLNRSKLLTPIEVVPLVLSQ